MSIRPGVGSLVRVITDKFDERQADPALKMYGRIGVIMPYDSSQYVQVKLDGFPSDYTFPFDQDELELVPIFEEPEVQETQDELRLAAARLEELSNLAEEASAYATALADTLDKIETSVLS